MRHRIIRRNKKIILLLFLLVFAGALFYAPWIKRHIFIQDNSHISEDAYKEFEFSDILSRSSSDETVSLDVDFLNDGYIFSAVRIRGLDVRGFKVSGDILIKGRLSRTNDGLADFSGKMLSKNMTFDAKPVPKLRASFRALGDRLEIEALRLARPYELTGAVGLKEPFESDLRFEIKRADINDIALVTGIKESIPMLGIMNGVFYAKGPLGGLFSNGMAQSRNGRIGSVDYDVITLRFEGFGPMINILDSTLKQGTGTMTLDGYIDLRRIGKSDLFSGLRVRSDLKTIVWKDWDIIKKSQDELMMTKSISDNMSIGFKTMTRIPLTTFYDRENPEEMSLEYKIGEENLKMKLRENEEFFGVEHSVKF